MIGATIGDFVGSRFEFDAVRHKDFVFMDRGCAYTDDTVMTAAVAEAILRDHGSPDFAGMMRRLGEEEPEAGYGAAFKQWLRTPGAPAYGSWANGAAMRVSPCAWLAKDFEDAMHLARLSAEVSHDHPQAIRSAQAVTAAIYAGLSGWMPADTKRMVTDVFGYDLSRSVDQVRETSSFELRASVSVPEAIICALDAESFEDAVRNAVSLGADSDTQGAIAGSIAEAFYEVPTDQKTLVLNKTPELLRGIIVRATEVAASNDRRRIAPADLDGVKLWSEDMDVENETFMGRPVETDKEVADRWELIGESVARRDAARSPRPGWFKRLFGRS